MNQNQPWSSRYSGVSDTTVSVAAGLTPEKLYLLLWLKWGELGKKIWTLICRILSQVTWCVLGKTEQFPSSYQGSQANVCLQQGSKRAIFGKLWLRFQLFNTLRLEQNGHHFADNTFEYILFLENLCAVVQISLNLDPLCQIDTKSKLVQNNGLMQQVITWTYCVV